MKKLLLLAVFAACASCTSSDKHTATNKAANDTILAFLQKRHVPGMAVAISVDGQLVFSKGYGLADVEQQVPVDPEKSAFRIGSIAKLLTAIGLGQLMEQNKIQIDSSIYYYLPDFPRKKWRPTLRQIAGHQGGIRHYKGNEMQSNVHYQTVTEGLSIFKDDSLEYKPGTQYSYSSYGFNLLSAAIEKSAGTDFLTFMNQEVIRKIGLTHTFADVNDSIIPYRTRFYVVEQQQVKNAPSVDNSYKWAGGGFVSSANDLIKVGHALLNHSMLSENTLKILTTAQPLPEGEVSHYGMGFSVGKDDKGNDFFGHSGGSVGGTSNFVIYPRQKIVVVVLTNRSGANLGEIAEHLAQLYMK